MQIKIDILLKVLKDSQKQITEIENLQKSPNTTVWTNITSKHDGFCDMFKTI